MQWRNKTKLHSHIVLEPKESWTQSNMKQWPVESCLKEPWTGSSFRVEGRVGSAVSDLRGDPQSRSPPVSWLSYSHHLCFSFQASFLFFHWQLPSSPSTLFISRLLFIHHFDVFWISYYSCRQTCKLSMSILLVSYLIFWTFQCSSREQI